MKKKEEKRIIGGMLRILFVLQGILGVVYAQGQSCEELNCSGTCACRFIEVSFREKYADLLQKLSYKSPLIK